jgi:23S rRNA (adenine2503-C2)-methyltransferase
MKVIQRTANNELATVYIAENEHGNLVEFVESIQPPVPLSEKWVVIISTLFGCPIDCTFCDAGGNFRGKLTADELLFQIDFLVRSRFESSKPETNRFKIQFSRMGEPSFNPAVLTVLRQIHKRYVVPELVPSLSTIGPVGAGNFFQELISIKKELYQETFQLQFSLHSTDQAQRDKLIPVRKISFRDMADYGEKFYNPTGKKITLNFALTEDTILDPDELLRYFNPEIFLVKVTPMNPTYKAEINELKSILTPETDHHPVVDILKERGYEVIKSIGEWEENHIGSNCGQYVNTLVKKCGALKNSYTASLENL